MVDLATFVRPVSTEETYPLRLKILRPGRPLNTAQFAEDERATHFGCFVSENLIGVATLFEQPLKDDSRLAFQLRGMAIDDDYQGRGYGEQLVRACCDFAREHAANLIWCNARIEASRFYLKQGFAIHGEPFLIPDVGPHYVMWRVL